jgi:DMSO/TMAO reductase YedYZ molybdopterin-dependent catalytic subunit/thiosulfate reductase cytochrome b subunit
MGELAEGVRDNPLVFPPAPEDRRLYVSFRRPVVALVCGLGLVPVVCAWVWYLAAGLPELRPLTPAGPEGFPGWLRLSHFANLMLMVFLVRSGFSVLLDHPRLYWNDHCTPGSDWARFTPLAMPRDREWTAKQDSRFLTAWLGLPGYRHTVGIARHWHFLAAFFWLANGVAYVALLAASGYWRRLIPTDVSAFTEAAKVFVHYATLHLPPAPNRFVAYNPLQQFAYAGVVLGLAPLSILTGLAMSPALGNRAGWYPRLFGGRQSARSLHFLLLCGYLGFLVTHVTMVAVTGLRKNLNHITLGTDDDSLVGLFLFLAGLVAVAAACAAAHWASWHRPRWVQAGFRRLLGPLQQATLHRLPARVQHDRSEISPFFWTNGKLPTCPEWEALGPLRREGYRLRVSGLVARPVELSIADLERLGKREQVTLHHCIQGWTGVAQWGGVTVRQLMDAVQPLPDARVVVFRSFGEGHYGGEYYDTLTIDNASDPQTLLAWEMNDGPLPDRHGAPLRLRVENQLGYKMVKWIKSIEFVKSEAAIGKGYGGKNEDDEYYP